MEIGDGTQMEHAEVRDGEGTALENGDGTQTEHTEVRDGEGTALETERKRNTPRLETVKVPPWRRNANGTRRG